MGFPDDWLLGIICGKNFVDLDIVFMRESFSDGSGRGPERLTFTRLVIWGLLSDPCVDER
eukprot:CAMPEP_0201485656 /NCGR_PEP_ID=MMETSP0151_2-20130828/9751_1 /ASSEMBLY_ACC=CAM_ASM_000257 /TAXON_ID=200890 /ORGANISM="Paramoeba atlantica, Strain 621/1 / CCAP 1560/9" /LENGTH=59 /DNA_ID=CAMNT_0047869889 /DNA_START=778 /DNA_END=957 /DNA_ORIENTATION=+